MTNREKYHRGPSNRDEQTRHLASCHYQYCQIAEANETKTNVCLVRRVCRLDNMTAI